MATRAKDIQRISIPEEYSSLRFAHDHLRDVAAAAEQCFRNIAAVAFWSE